MITQHVNDSSFADRENLSSMLKGIRSNRLTYEAVKENKLAGLSVEKLHPNQDSTPQIGFTKKKRNTTNIKLAVQTINEKEDLKDIPKWLNTGKNDSF